MCKQWLPEHTFACLTDIPEQVECESVRLTTEAKGWWAKMELFLAFQGPTLFFDLDTIIRSDASCIVANAAKKEFVILRDFYRGRQDKSAMQSSVMWWSGDMRWVWDRWQSSGGKSSLRGDQDFLEECFRDTGKSAEFWQDVAPDYFCSFKADIRDATTKSQAPVVCFHGSPRPWDQYEVAYPLTKDPFNGESIVVVGNGPSLIRQKLGRVIDAFDQVVRINAFDLHGLEEHTGRVTTIHATHGKSNGRRGSYACDHTLWLHEHAAWETRKSWLVPKSFYWSLVLPWAPDRSILPSAGFVTVAWLLKQGVPVVHLAGFDHFGKGRSKAHHYWESTPKSQPKEHSPEREMATFETWRQSGRAAYL